jgi:hypothetical protein
MLGTFTVAHFESFDLLRCTTLQARARWTVAPWCHCADFAVLGLQQRFQVLWVLQIGQRLLDRKERCHVVQRD